MSFKIVKTMRFFVAHHAGPRPNPYRMGQAGPQMSTFLLRTRKTVMSTRCYCKPADVPSSSKVPPPPTPPRLPTKAQLEKFLFRTIAFAWDVTYFSYLWLVRNFHVHVAQHPTVRTHWKNFLEKIENSRKD